MAKSQFPLILLDQFFCPADARGPWWLAESAFVAEPRQENGRTGKVPIPCILYWANFP